ncbi:Pfam methyltransferase 26 [Fragilaria crotonensis]|nr:Pfam methyltransferase 26 [Fragilaria crotonensis]
MRTSRGVGFGLPLFVIVCWYWTIATPRRTPTAAALAIGFNGNIGIAKYATHANYAEARLVRSQQGHEAAQSLYQELLRIHPSDTTAGTCIAASPDTPVRHDSSCRNLDRTLIQQLRTTLDKHNYTNAAVQSLLNVPLKLRYAASPVYVTPLAAGSETSKTTPTPQTGLETLVALFLLGTTQPKHLVETHLGPSFITLLQDLGLAFVDSNYNVVTHSDQHKVDMDVDAPCVVVPYVHLFPLALTLDQGQDHNLIFATDLHPRVLSSTTVGSKHHPAVMYIGPDSLALVQHYTNRFVNNNNNLGTGKIIDTVLDVCTGSGIQALSVVSCRTSICVDLNPRALTFVQFNAALNGRDNVRCILGDVVKGEYQEIYPPRDDDDEPLSPQPLLPLLQDGSVDLLLANPPFIPVPPHDDGIAHRYGMFSSGGPDGLVVVRAILQLAARVLRDDDVATMAMVSEFCNPSVETATALLPIVRTDDKNNDNNDDGNDDDGATTEPTLTGLLCTNEIPVSAETYAARRADSEEEFGIWNNHFERIGIRTVSPGLLYLRRRCRKTTNQGEEDTTTSGSCIQHCLVPKTEQGSIWTPSNEDAVEYTSRAWSRIVNSQSS